MENQIAQYSGFWRRAGAFAIDLVVLGIAGSILAYPFFDMAASLGAWGKLIGFIIAGLYFCLLNGPIGKGQTLGKRLLGIRVVHTDGSPLSLPSSAVRYLPLALPYFMNNLPLGSAALQSYWIYALSVAVFGIGLSTIYLFTFNRPSHQVLHDLLVNSYVVRDPATPISEPGVKKRHYIVCGALLVTAIVIPYFTNELTSSEKFSGLLKVQSALESVSWVQHAGVSQGTSYSSPSNKTYLSLSVKVNDGRITDETRATDIVMLAMKAAPEMAKVDSIQVVMTHGFDIGIASGWQTQSFVRSPAEWKDMGL